MTEKSLNDTCNCNGSGWVCENHPDQPFEHIMLWIGKIRFAKTRCNGAGMPCTCNKSVPPWEYISKEVK